MTTLPQFGQPISKQEAAAPVPLGWELIEDTAMPDNTVQVDVTGLDGDADEVY